jgi:hypothetical protein
VATLPWLATVASMCTGYHLLVGGGLWIWLFGGGLSLVDGDPKEVVIPRLSLSCFDFLCFLT